MSLFDLPQVIEAEAAPLTGSGINLRNFNKNYILFWNHAGLELNRLTHTSSGPQDGPPVSARALAILHLAIHDAYFGILPYTATSGIGSSPGVKQYLVPPPMGTSAIPRSAREAKDAVAGAAITVLTKLYKDPNKPNSNASINIISALGSLLDSLVRAYVIFNSPNVLSAGYAFGVKVANTILEELEIKKLDPGVSPRLYMPKSKLADYHPYFFDDDPSHPVRLRPLDPNQPDPDKPTQVTRPYHGPFYGKTAALFATTKDWKIADPYVVPGDPPPPPEDLKYPEYLESIKEYLESVEDVHRMGGAEGLPSTKRRPDQTATALFWAYDGVNLIGTPPRLYNQIIRQIAFEKATQPIESDINNAEFARLFALANAAMADAGIFCWREKYRYELWRPLSGVRQDPTGPAPGGFARPFWQVLGAPATNSNEGGFKPPFPAYPSGHATFGAAAFQTVRRFYDKRDGDIFDPLEPTTASGENEAQKTTEGTDDPKKVLEPYHEFHRNDKLKFRFVSDELNGISRELYQRYDPSRPITDQPGDVRTRLVLEFDSMKEAIFSNAISRIWLGVHWNFDAFAAVDIMEKVPETEGPASDPQKLGKYKPVYQREADGSTTYKKVDSMDWFGATGTRKAREGELTPEGKPESFYYGGVPLGMLIADDIFESGMKFIGSLQDLSVNDPKTRTEAPTAEMV